MVKQCNCNENIYKVVFLALMNWTPSWPSWWHDKSQEVKKACASKFWCLCNMQSTHLMHFCLTFLAMQKRWNVLSHNVIDLPPKCKLWHWKHCHAHRPSSCLTDNLPNTPLKTKWNASPNQWLREEKLLQLKFNSVFLGWADANLSLDFQRTSGFQTNLMPKLGLTRKLIFYFSLCFLQLTHGTQNSNAFLIESSLLRGSSQLPTLVPLMTWINRLFPTTFFPLLCAFDFWQYHATIFVTSNLVCKEFSCHTTSSNPKLHP